MPYIGVTGVMSREESEGVIGAWATSGLKTRLMVGVLASSNTLAHQKSRWPNRLPLVEEIRNIFVPGDNVLNLIHYNTSHPETLFRQIIEIMRYAGPSCQGIQLNVAWPQHWVLEAYRKMENSYIVLHIGNRALDICGHEPGKVAQRVSAYKGLVNAVLIDPSGGLGRPFDPNIVAIHLDAVRAVNSWVEVGAAGGLGPDTLAHLERLIKFCGPTFNIDAEGLVRDEVDNLDLNKVRRYFEGAQALYTVAAA